VSLVCLCHAALPPNILVLDVSLNKLAGVLPSPLPQSMTYLGATGVGLTGVLPDLVPQSNMRQLLLAGNGFEGGCGWGEGGGMAPSGGGGAGGRKRLLGGSRCSIPHAATAAGWQWIGRWVGWGGDGARCVGGGEKRLLSIPQSMTYLGATGVGLTGVLPDLVLQSNMRQLLPAGNGFEGGWMAS
jgi:hypothetical protein